MTDNRIPVFIMDEAHPEGEMVLVDRTIVAATLLAIFSDGDDDA
jgi:hypothetical protein